VRVSDERAGSAEDAATARFGDLVDEFIGRDGVVPPGATTGFGHTALRVNGKIFAMIVRGSLVVKLPKARVDELVANRHGIRFDANKGTPMKEWLAVDADSAIDWTAIATEAYTFVSSGGRTDV
jgi:hypothetical protein